jgi:hypothetical protein
MLLVCMATDNFVPQPFNPLVYILIRVSRIQPKIKCRNLLKSPWPRQWLLFGPLVQCCHHCQYKVPHYVNALWHYGLSSSVTMAGVGWRRSAAVVVGTGWQQGSTAVGVAGLESTNRVSAKVILMMDSSVWVRVHWLSKNHSCKRVKGVALLNRCQWDSDM